MSSQNSPALLVARFLQANHYNDVRSCHTPHPDGHVVTDNMTSFKTLDVFLREAGLPPDAGTIANVDMTIEKILEEKRVFDLSENFERIETEDGRKGWSVPGQHTTISSHFPIPMY